MPNGDQRIDVWKAIALALVGILITGATSWLTFGSRYMTKDEITSMIQTRSPYVLEREFIRDKLSSLDRISTALDLVKSDVVRLNVKIDLLMARFPGGEAK